MGSRCLQGALRVQGYGGLRVQDYGGLREVSRGLGGSRYVSVRVGKN